MDYSAGSAGASAFFLPMSSPVVWSTCFIDSRTLPRSSKPKSFTFTAWPSLTTSLGLATRCAASSLTWTRPSDVVKEGQAVKVKLLGFDDRGKVRLSMKQVDQTTGEDIGKKPAEPKADAPQA